MIVKIHAFYWRKSNSMLFYAVLRSLFSNICSEIFSLFDRNNNGSLADGDAWPGFGNYWLFFRH